MLTGQINLAKLSLPDLTEAPAGRRAPAGQFPKEVLLLMGILSVNVPRRHDDAALLSACVSLNRPQIDPPREVTIVWAGPSPPGGAVGRSVKQPVQIRE